MSNMVYINPVDTPGVWIGQLHSGFVDEPNLAAERLKNELEWVRPSTSRSEYYTNQVNVPYTYGTGRGERTYQVQPTHEVIEQIRAKLEARLQSKFEVCFLNMYLNGTDFLGWHADDSPEMDPDRPIVTVSLGAEREIWFCPQSDTSAQTHILLPHGSAFVMRPGLQATHFHRIPKASRPCGPRISLTFRGYVDPTNVPEAP